MTNVPLHRGIATYSRNYFSFERIEENEVQIVDVAKGLSNVCRFAGQCEEFYSVAEHSVLVSHIAERSGAPWSIVFAALMHDASEALMGDMTTPLKKLIPDYLEIETRLQCYLMDRLAPGALVNEHFIRTADLVALAIEQRDIMHNTDRWDVLLYIYNVPQVQEFSIREPLPPKAAYEQFLARYTECLINTGKETTS